MTFQQHSKTLFCLGGYSKHGLYCNFVSRVKRKCVNFSTEVIVCVLHNASSPKDERTCFFTCH